MTDTAQPFTAADPVQAAAALFRAVDNGTPVNRDEAGRFAAPETIEPEAEAAEVEAPDDSAEVDVAAEAAEEAQPEAVAEMPASWPKEDAEAWNALPPAAQAIIAQREGQRDAAVNQKFQEAANVRRAASEAAQAAASKRDEYAQQLDQIIGLISPVAPDPQRYIDADGNFDGNQYAWDKAQYDQAALTVQGLQQQRQAIAAQQSQAEQDAVRGEWETDGQRLAVYPDFAPEKVAATFSQIETYSNAAGIPAGALATATPVEVEMVWKAMQYDRMTAAKARVAPIAKPAAPNVRAGVATPKAAIADSQRAAVMSRLEKTGTLEAGAALWKMTMKGK